MRRAMVISGGSRGIGRAACECFRRDHYRVLSLSRSPHPDPAVHGLQVDFADIHWVGRHGPALLEALDGVEEIVLIHNAATLGKDAVQSLDADALQRVLQVNVVAASQLNRLLLPRMGPGSSILYVGSTLSEKAVANSCSYVVSKHAQLGLMRATAQDLQGSGVHTVCVCPGFTDTEMLRAHLGHDESVVEAVAALNSFGRLVAPDEIARTLLFCAQNPVLNGSVLHANLGQREG